MTTATQAIADFATETQLAQVPPEIAHEAKLLLLDLIGCALVGATVDKGAIAVKLAQRLGGATESTIFGIVGQVSSVQAAFANGELMNALDWDPIPHTLPCVVAACLAIAESKKASGQDLIVGIVLGNEISSRLAAVLPSDLEAQPHGYGSCILGAAAGVGRILGLRREVMTNALGIAGFAAPIPAMTRFEDGISPIPMTKYISIGWVAQGAVTATLLAELGYTGDTQIFDGPEGFWRLFGGTAERWNTLRLTQGLGTHWIARKAWYKPYPCEVLIGVALNRLRDIMQENTLSADDIEAVDFRSIPVLATPCHTTTKIVSHIDAQFSVPYAMAVAALGIEPGPAWQEEATMHDPEVDRFMQKVTVGIHADELKTTGAAKQAPSVGQIPCHLAVHAKGQTLTFERTEPFMTETQIIAKFESNAATCLPPNKVDKARRMIMELEEVGDVGEIMSCLVP